MTFRSFVFLLAGLVLWTVIPETAAAQYRHIGTRALVPSPVALGMGGAAAAYPSPRTALFYNPAHLTQVQVSRAPITMLGLSLSISNNVTDQIDFYNQRLQPAVEQGIETLDEAQEQALYDEVFKMAETPTVLRGDVLLPSFVINRGRYGFGGGLFAHTEWTYNVEDTGSRVPGVDFTALADLIAAASIGTDLSSLGLKGFSIGVTTKYAQRYVSLKVKPVDELDALENFYVLGASAAVADIGLLYEATFIPVPGKLYVGLVRSDLTFKDFDYRFTSYWEKHEETQNEAAIAAEIALAQERYQLRSTLRVGVAYVAPRLGGPFRETAIALDYIQQNDPFLDQPFLNHLSLGLQSTVGSVFSVRAGLNQGYTTVGAGIQLSFIRLDYAFYGSEVGRLPGQPASRHHHVQISLGSF